MGWCRPLRGALAAVALLLAATLVTGCTPNPPPRWAEGGAPVEIPRARWVVGQTVTDVDPSGTIRINGEPSFTIDAAGRVVDVDANPVALLEADGRVVGPDGVDLGFVGAASAALPGHRDAWLAITPAGGVTRFDPDGERHAFGAWLGECHRSPATQQVCLLVSHLLGLRMRYRGFMPGGVSFGVGVGVGFGVGR